MSTAVDTWLASVASEEEDLADAKASKPAACVISGVTYASVTDDGRCQIHTPIPKANVLAVRDWLNTNFVVGA